MADASFRMDDTSARTQEHFPGMSAVGNSSFLSLRYGLLW